MRKEANDKPHVGHPRVSPPGDYFDVNRATPREEKANSRAKHVVPIEFKFRHDVPILLHGNLLHTPYLPCPITPRPSTVPPACVPAHNSTILCVIMRGRSRPELQDGLSGNLHNGGQCCRVGGTSRN